MSEYLVPTYKPFALKPKKASGVKITDENGEVYLDWSGGIAVNCLGHCYPEILEVLNKQAHRLWHTSNYFLNTPAEELAKTLTARTFAEQVFFANSGAEANEAALKLSRLYANKNFGDDKNQIHAFIDGFHGRTLFTVAVGGTPSYSEGFGDLPANISHTKFNDIAQLENKVGEYSCAIILEPIQGEGGIRVAELEFLQKIRQLCDKYQILLIFDEVQTGISRTGTFYYYQQLGIEPDILTTAKGLGGGFPISAMLTKKKIAKVFQPGTHGTTFGGNPLACSIAKKVVEIVTREDFLQAVKEKSKIFLENLNQINKKYGIFSEIRGAGMMLGAELLPQYEIQTFLKYALKQKLIMLPAGGNVLRLLPSLNISETEIEQGFYKLDFIVKDFIKNE
jgi:predicted acetylornithine/succinylornithine family transaminase